MFKPGMSTYRDILATQFVPICEEPIRFTGGGGLHSKNESQSGGIFKNVKKALASRTNSQAPIDGFSIISIRFFAFTECAMTVQKFLRQICSGYLVTQVLNRHRALSIGKESDRYDLMLYRI